MPYSKFTILCLSYHVNMNDVFGIGSIPTKPSFESKNAAAGISRTKLKLSVKPTDNFGVKPPFLLSNASIVYVPRGRVPAVGMLAKYNGG